MPRYLFLFIVSTKGCKLWAVGIIKNTLNGVFLNEAVKFGNIETVTISG
jgi:hypothetical protein